MLHEALSYAALGWRVMPLFSWSKRGCTCGSRECKSPAKHPVLPAWQYRATTKPAWLREWFAGPLHNIGIATGRLSGFLVVDCDGDEGLYSWRQLERRNGDAEETATALIGGGGTHFLFRMPLDTKIGNRTGIFPGVDIRADGGYIVAPPSLHESGRRYVWEATCGPDQVALADPPEWLLAMLTEPKRPEAQPVATGSGFRPADPSPILSGCAWLRHAILDAAALPRDEWIALLSVAAAMTDGERLAHQWSSPHPGYTPKETAYQLASVSRSMAPVTCRTVRGRLRGAGYCAGCPHAGRVNSPVMLARGRLADLDAEAPRGKAR